MKHRVTWLSVLPLALAMVNLADAGFRCGGCSDPCRPTRSNLGCGRSAAGSCGSVGGCGHSVVEASPDSCGAVASDGTYGMSYGPSVGCGTAPSMNYAHVQVMHAPSQMVSQAPCQQAVSIAPQVVCEPVTGYRTVMESSFVTETQYVNATETRQETRTRVKQVSRSVLVTVEDFRTKTVMVPTTETKTIEYSVLVPEQSTKTVDVTVTVPVWNEVSENYTVKVPTISDVAETYNVNVARLRDESFTYNVFVPQTETVTKMQTVTNSIPVVKTRTVQRTVPSYSTQSVTKDYGHWESVVEEVAGSCYGATDVVSSAPAMSISYSAPAMSYSGGCGNAAMASTVVSGGGCGNGIFGRSGGCRLSGCRSSKCGSASCGSGSCGCGAPASPSCGCGAPVSSSCGSSAGSSCGGNAIVSGNVVYGGSISGGCGVSTSVAAAPATRTATRRFWVPSVVTEEVPVVTNSVQSEEVAYTVYEQQSTQIPYECAYVVYRPEQRTGSKKVVEYVSEPRTRTRKVVTYTDEQRTRSRRVLSYTTQTKQETYPVVTYKTENKTKDISFTVNVPTQTVEPIQTTRYETVTDDVVEEYIVSVQVPTTREVQVQVCKMVPRLVAYTFNPCAGAASSGSTGGCGCGATAPASSGCGCGAAVPAASGCGCGAPVAAPASGCGCAN